MSGMGGGGGVCMAFPFREAKLEKSAAAPPL